MSQLVCSNAQLQCSFGLAPAMLTVLPTNKVLTGNQPAATIMDNKPMVNIKPFGMCQSLANPQVAAATAAAMGVLTPQPCIPNVVAPWVPGSATVMIGSMPALNSTCTANCLWAGVITITNAGQQTVQIP
ncbi:MAG: DUF4280 domain-containing protein [Chloroflexota bacterium]